MLRCSAVFTTCLECIAAIGSRGSALGALSSAVLLFLQSKKSPGLALDPTIYLEKMQ